MRDAEVQSTITAQEKDEEETFLSDDSSFYGKKSCQLRILPL